MIDRITPLQMRIDGFTEALERMQDYMAEMNDEVHSLEGLELQGYSRAMSGVEKTLQILGERLQEYDDEMWGLKREEALHEVRVRKLHEQTQGKLRSFL